jgi:hypothetical protein
MAVLWIVIEFPKVLTFAHRPTAALAFALAVGGAAAPASSSEAGFAAETPFLDSNAAAMDRMVPARLLDTLWLSTEGPASAGT